MNRTRSSGLLALMAVVLVAVLLASPARAQQEPPDGITDERFSNEETRRLGRDVNSREASYYSIDDQIDELDPVGDLDRIQQLEDRQNELDSEYPGAVEAFIEARLEAIDNAPAEGSPEERIETLEAKQDAVERLQDYARGELSYSDDYYPVATSDLYPDYSEDIEAASEAGEAAGDSKPPAASGGLSNGSGGEPQSSATGSGDGRINVAQLALLAVLVAGGLAVFARGRHFPSSLRDALRALTGPRLATAAGEPDREAGAAGAPFTESSRTYGSEYVNEDSFSPHGEDRTEETEMPEDPDSDIPEDSEPPNHGPPDSGSPDPNNVEEMEALYRAGAVRGVDLRRHHGDSEPPIHPRKRIRRPPPEPKDGEPGPGSPDPNTVGGNEDIPDDSEPPQ